ncbi:hypothetical protein AAKU67_003709 [Oxalobacteraceae bacterium GrIS 2.11]
MDDLPGVNDATAWQHDRFNLSEGWRSVRWHTNANGTS